MPKKANPLKSLYRLTVMAGVITVGSMAAYRYGPPPERLASMIDSAVNRVSVLSERLAEPDADAAAPVSNAAPAAEWRPPATGDNALAPLPPANDISVAPLGTSGLAYRATASLSGSGGLTQQFDAIAATADEAQRLVRARVEAARRGS